MSGATTLTSIRKLLAHAEMHREIVPGAAFANHDPAAEVSLSKPRMKTTNAGCDFLQCVRRKLCVN